MTQAYVNDVPYVRQFVPELAPARIRLAAAVNGLVPPPSADFDYCELGCGHGDTLAALAAAHPRARFLGVDIGAAHIASAKRLARDGALENIGFLERDFEALLDEEIGAFDYVVAHGVLTWIGPEKRKAMIALAQRMLKPGGLLYVTYNAMPGWSAVEPLRQLLLSPLGQAPEGSSLDRAKSGLAFAQLLQSSGAEYFAKNPSATEMLGAMTRAGLPYVVHEYLHEHWTPMYFARVAWEMAAHDLHFAGVLPLLLNFRESAIPEPLEKAFADITDRLRFESVKDFAINEFFRRDVYVHGKQPRSGESMQRFLDETPWSTLLVDCAERVVRLPHRSVRLEGAIYDAIFDATAHGAKTLADIEGFERDKLRTAMLRMLVAERAIPMQERIAPAKPDPNARFAIASDYNRMMLRRLGSETPLVMISERAGTAFTTSAIEGLALRALTEAEPGAREAWLRDFAGKHVLRLAVGDKVVESREEQEKILLAALEQLVTQKLARLVELGVVAQV
ncbi:MAG TPA: class I SAM-dependent methyltransferase [Labilithrix sp.]